MSKQTNLAFTVRNKTTTTTTFPTIPTTVPTLTELSINIMVGWLLDTASGSDNIRTTNARNLQASFATDHPDTTPLENWAWRIFEDAHTSRDSTEWLHTASSELYPAQDLGILQIAYHAANIEKAPLEAWAWLEFQVITDQPRESIGSPCYLTKDPNTKQQGHWQKAVTCEGRARHHFPAAETRGELLPPPPTATRRQEASVLELLSQIPDPEASTGESSLLNEEGAFEDTSIPVADEVEIGEEMAEAGTNIKTETMKSSIQAIKDLTNVNTAQYPSQILHLFLKIKKNTELIITLLTQTQKTVETLNADATCTQQTIHSLKQQIKGLESTVKNLQKTTPPQNTNQKPSNSNNDKINQTTTNKNSNDNNNQADNNNNKAPRNHEKRMYANAAANANDNGNNTNKDQNKFTTVQHKKKAPTPFFNTKTHRLDRQVWIDTTKPISDTITDV